MERTLPNNPEAEEAMVGGILFAGRCFVDVAEIAGAAELYDPGLRVIFEACAELDQQSRPIDLLTVAEHMRTTGAMVRLKGRGGEAYLAELANKVATVENIAYHAQIVRDKATARRLIEAASTIQAKGYGQQLEVAVLADEAERLIFAAADRSSHEKAAPLARLTPQILESLERAAETGGKVTPGIPTGLRQFDRMTAGLVPSELVLLAARPSMGKSTLMSCLAVSTRVPALIFSLEMRRADLALRLLASEARVNLQALRGTPQPEDMRKVRGEVKRVTALPIAIDDSGTVTLMEIRARARRWRSKIRGPAVVFVDYLQLISAPPGRGREQNREREISEISRGLKLLAKELDAPVVALSQLNRSVEARQNKRPMLSDLRESGGLEQDADVVLFVYRDEVYHKDSKDRGVAELIIAKQRNGPTGTVRLAFLGQYTRFENLADVHREPDPAQGSLL